MRDNLLPVGAFYKTKHSLVVVCIIFFLFLFKCKTNFNISYICHYCNCLSYYLLVGKSAAAFRRFL